VAAGAIKALELAANSAELREQLQKNTQFFRHGLEQLGFELLPGEHPIVPIMLGDASLAARFAAEMLNQGVYVVAFSYPVVAPDRARIRTQMSAAFNREDLEFALAGFARVKQQLGL